MWRRSRITHHRQHLLILAVGLAHVAGCHFKGDWIGGAPGVDAPAEHWRIEPVQIRIYPTTRFTTRQGSTVLKARVELFDEMGDSVKAVGRFQFGLYRDGDQGDGSLAKRLYTWHVSTLTLDDQRQFYESVSRTYLFVLDLGQWKPQPSAALRVTFTFPHGARLETTAVLDGEFHRPKLPAPSAPPAPIAPAIQPAESTRSSFKPLHQSFEAQTGE